MRILFGLFKYTPYGGLERDMMRMAECAAGRGHDLTILAGRWEGPLPTDPKIAVQLLSLHARSNHGRAAEFDRRFRMEAGRLPHSVSVAFNRFGGADFYFAADNCLACTLPEKHHPLWLKLLPRYRTYLRLEREIFSPSSPTRIFYITPGQKSDYIAAYDTPEERFCYLPPGINNSCRRPVDYDCLRVAKRSELGVLEDELMLILVGANLNLKGADRAIAALAALPAEWRQRSKLFLVGGGGIPKLTALAKQVGVERQVFFPGRSDEVPALLAAADLMVHPARSEATGTVLIEALAAGVPVVCSAACGFRNYVLESGGRVTAGPFRQPELNEAVERMVSELPQRREQAIAYGAAADFYRRAEVAVDRLEEFGKE